MSNSASEKLARWKPHSEEWREARKLAQRLHWDKLYANWLKAHAANEDPDGDESDVQGVRRSDAMDEAARQLFIAPSILEWMVWKKIEVFEFYLRSELESSFADCRIHAFWGCIKADLERHGIGGADV